MEGMISWLIWPFWTQRRKWFFVLEYGLEDTEGQSLTVEIQDPTVKIQTYLHLKEDTR